MVWCPRSPYATQSDSEEEAEAYIAALAGEDGDRKLIHTFVEHAPEMLRYLVEELGIKYYPIPYTDYHADQAGGKLGYRSHDLQPIDGRVLGDHLAKLQPPHATNMLGFISWTAAEWHRLSPGSPVGSAA